MSCDNVITVQDLETDKKHSTFYREVITGKAGGTGDDIDSATNAVTGQTQATLPKVLSNVGFSPSGFDFTTGGTLTERDKAIFYQTDGNWYSWGGALPKVVPPASSPASTGGIADNAWNVSTSAFMYRDWEGFTAELLAQAGIVDDGQPDELGNSQRVDAILKLIRLKTSVISLLDFGAVGDGVTDDTVAIKNAITSASGGVLIIPSGDYLYTNGNTRDEIHVNDVVIKNHGRIITPRGLRITGDDITVIGGKYGRLTKSTNPNINYECGLSITGARANIRGVECTNADGAGLILASQYATVSNCKFSDNIMGALLSPVCSHVVVSSNEITNNNVNTKSGADGLNIQRNTDNIQVLNNLISGSGEHGVYFQGMSSTFKGNTVHSNTGSGLKFGSHPDGQASKPILNPVISQDGTIVQQGGFGIVVESNSCYDNGGDHIYFQPSFKFVEIHDNTCWNTDPNSNSYGVKLTYFTGVGEGSELQELKDFKIYNNSFRNCTITSECNGTFISGNYVEGDIVLYAGDGGKTGQARNVAEHTVVHNTVKRRSNGSGGSVNISRCTYPLIIKDNEMETLICGNGDLNSIVVTANVIKSQSASIDFTRMRNFDRNKVTIVGDIPLNSGTIAYGFSRSFIQNDIYAPNRSSGVVINASFNSTTSANGVFSLNTINAPMTNRAVVAYGDGITITGNVFIVSSSADFVIDYNSKNGVITGNSANAGAIKIRNTADGNNVVVGNGLRCSDAGTTVNIGNRV